MTATSMPQGTFSRWGISVSQEESPSFSCGEDVNDANHLLYLARANKLFVTGHEEDVKSGLDAIDADVLLLPAAGDLLLFPEYSERARELLDDGTREVDLVPLEGPLGHLDGVVGIDQASDQIRSFLED